MKKVNYFDAMIMLLSAVVVLCFVCANTSVMGFIISKAVAFLVARVVYVKYGQWQTLNAFCFLKSIKE